MELKVFESTYDKQTHAYRVGEEPLVFHCHHYNLFLQNTIEDGGAFYNAEKLQVQAAEHVKCPPYDMSLYRIIPMKEDIEVIDDMFRKYIFQINNPKYSGYSKEIIYI